MTDEIPSSGPGSNTGHGHLWRRPDGALARCGGVALCKKCQQDLITYFPERVKPKHNDTKRVTRPTVGDLVIYTSYGTPNGEYKSLPRMAHVTEVPDLLPEQPNEGPDGYVPAVHLCVVNPTGLFFKENVEYSETPRPGYWSFRNGLTAVPH